MLDTRDPAIKLFGKTIPVTGDGEDSNDTSNCSDQQELDKDFAEEESMETEQSDDPPPPTKEESADPHTISESNENQKEPDSEMDSETLKDEKDSNESNNLQQKQLKKPDKILPCPRCNSMDTKFCYYNNYNINQPRHFCKSCQRYWTAGGTMRNVPVGAGRRKNKSSASRYCHITVSEALQVARLDIPNGVHHLKTNGTVLTFGSDNPLCESMASVLNIADKNVLNANPRNGFHNIDHVIPVPCQSRPENDDRSSGSTVTTTTTSMDSGVKRAPQQEPMKQNLNGFANQMPCFQWPYMWNPHAVPVPPFCPSGYPMSFYPAPFWNGAIPWNMPWVSPCSPTSPGQKSPGSNPNSPTLGKHSREGEMLNHTDNEKSSGTTTVLVPKTLRIDDPDEAAKSSIWSTLGINKEKGDPISKRGFFNSFQTKGDTIDHKTEASPTLKANPAAFCRSISFQESSSR